MLIEESRSNIDLVVFSEESVLSQDIEKLSYKITLARRVNPFSLLIGNCPRSVKPCHIHTLFVGELSSQKTIVLVWMFPVNEVNQR